MEPVLEPNASLLLLPCPNDSGSGVNPSARPPLPHTVRLLKQVLYNLDLYLVPVIVLVGVLGNSVSFVVFLCTHLRRQSCNIYLASLAVSDNAFLLTVILSWYSKVGGSTYNNEGWCQLLVYLTYVSSFLSVWYIVALTLERFIAVCYPLRRGSICTTHKATVAVVAIAVLALITYSFAVFTSGVQQMPGFKICAPKPEYFKAVSTINNVDTLVTLIVPTALIIGCNIRIALVVVQFSPCRAAPRASPTRTHTRIHFHAFSRDRAPSATSDTIRLVRHHGGGSSGDANLTTRAAHLRATKLLFLVSSVFLVCNLPSHVLRTYIFAMTMVYGEYKQTYAFILSQQFFHILYYINFSVNFFLYSLSGKSFRTGLRRIGVKLRQKARLWQAGRHLGASPRCSPRVVRATKPRPPHHRHACNVMKNPVVGL